MKQLRRYIAALFLLLPMVCQASPKTYSIVVSFSVLESFTHALIHGLEDKFTLHSIVKNGKDPHVFQPKASTGKLIQSASLVITNGLGFEEWLDRFIDSAKSTETHICVASKGVKPIIVHQAHSKGGKDEYDPHAWHNVNNALLYMANIHKVLCERFPTYKDHFTKNYKAYEKRLIDLDTWVKKQWQNIAHSQRNIVTTHDAFAYYGKAYDVNFISPLGVSTEQEPSVKEVADLITYIKANNICAFFSEKLSSDRLLKQIAKETGNTINGQLYADSIMESRLRGDAYILTIKHNTNALVRAVLGGC